MSRADDFRFLFERPLGNQFSLSFPPSLRPLARHRARRLSSVPAVSYRDDRIEGNAARAICSVESQPPANITDLPQTRARRPSLEILRTRRVNWNTYVMEKQCVLAERGWRTPLRKSHLSHRRKETKEKEKARERKISRIFHSLRSPCNLHARIYTHGLRLFHRFLLSLATLTHTARTLIAVGKTDLVQTSPREK